MPFFQTQFSCASHLKTARTVNSNQTSRLTPESCLWLPDREMLEKHRGSGEMGPFSKKQNKTKKVGAGRPSTAKPACSCINNSRRSRNLPVFVESRHCQPVQLWHSQEGLLTALRSEVPLFLLLLAKKFLDKVLITSSSYKSTWKHLSVFFLGKKKKCQPSILSGNIKIHQTAELYIPGPHKKPG